MILAYHRLSEDALDPSGLCVAPERFLEHMRVLSSLAATVSIDQLSRSLASGRLSGREVAVTFDDGYADNLYVAKPLLERFGIGATVFIPSAAIDREGTYWWDELQRIVFGSEALPRKLRLEIDGRCYHWRTRQSPIVGEDMDGTYRHWRVWKGKARTPRQILYAYMWQQLRELSSTAQEIVLEHLAAWAGAPPTSNGAHRTMTADEVNELTSHGLVDVGAHTVTHPLLESLPVSAQDAEIREGKARLEEITGRRITTFSYPYGRHSGDTRRLVRSAGFKTACTSMAGQVGPETDRYRLPRVSVGDWEVETFSREVRYWLGG